MNERTRQLMINAGTDTSGKWMSIDSADRFAEAIVKECMWKIMQRKEEAADNDWWVIEAMSAAISDISEHFGVEQ